MPEKRPGNGRARARARVTGRSLASIGPTPRKAGALYAWDESIYERARNKSYAANQPAMPIRLDLPLICLLCDLQLEKLRGKN